jgi:TetR/AcrR family transcriptional repressor of nem operon
MRYGKGHKAETRERVVKAALRRFRKDGIEGTGLAGLMADAGLTHGGFYAHFSSKDELVREALAASLAATRQRWARLLAAARERGESGLEAIVHDYLRPAHRDNAEAGCSVATLAPEIARRDAKSRDALSAAVEDIVATIAAELPAGQRPRGTSTAIFGLLVGTLQIARITRDPAASDAVLRAGREAALALARS